MPPPLEMLGLQVRAATPGDAGIAGVYHHTWGENVR